MKDQTTTLITDPATQTPEAKAKAEADAKAAAEGKKDDKAPPGAPEKYEPFTLPEGLELSEAVITAASELFKGANLDQATAQKFVDFHTNALKAVADSATNAYTTLRDGWRKEVLGDATLAANGDLLPEVKAQISKAIDSLGAAEATKFREALSLTGVGDHPAFVRAMKAFASRFGEGTTVTGKGPVTTKPNGGTAAPTPAQAMFPSLPSSAT